MKVILTTETLRTQNWSEKGPIQPPLQDLFMTLPHSASLLSPVSSNWLWVLVDFLRSRASSLRTRSAAVSAQLLPVQDKNKYLPLVGFRAEMWRMRKCWCVGGRRRPAALQHVGWPGSLCTLPVFLSSFTFDVKAETWIPLVSQSEQREPRRTWAQRQADSAARPWSQSHGPLLVLVLVLS